jgi:phosphoglycerate dehydrogenase-like enzyme
MEPLTIWTNYKMPEPVLADLRQRATPHQILGPGAEEAALAHANIAFGQPKAESVISLANLRWVHLNTAGYTKYDREDVRLALRARGAIMTNSSSVYDEPCAQHVLAMMLAITRQLPQALGNQLTLRDWSQQRLRTHAHLLRGQTALLVGFGAIARRLVEFLRPFNMNLIGVRRKVQGDEPIRIVRIDEIDTYLPQADHVINLLPSSRSTTQIFDADRFACLKRTAVFYNIGRGDTVDQLALRTMLETHHLAAAYLDVTSPEPLPPDDPLWITPNCFITPHTAGGHDGEPQHVVDHFVQNLKRFERGEALLDRIV